MLLFASTGQMQIGRGEYTGSCGGCVKDVSFAFVFAFRLYKKLLVAQVVLVLIASSRRGVPRLFDMSVQLNGGNARSCCWKLM